MSDTDYRKFAAETMIEVSKLLITLASGFFLLSTALLKLFTDGANDPLVGFWALALCWLCLLGSIGSGILALGGIATSAHDDNKFDVDASITNATLKGQQILFMLAFVFLAWLAFLNR